MGCASSKKRTTSVDDLTAGDKKDSASKKNGQLASNDAKRKPGAGDAIQIPGAHTSFMAPDGIPFIDEDVDDETGTAAPAGARSAAATRPDVNRNVVTPVAAGEGAKPSLVAPSVSVEKSAEDEKKKKEEEVVAEIKLREIEMTQNTSTTTTTTGRPQRAPFIAVQTRERFGARCYAASALR